MDTRMTSRTKSEPLALAQFRVLRKEAPVLWRLIRAIAILGVTFRLLLTVIAGNRAIAPFSGGSDQIRYRTLADSIFNGKGFTYFGQPTALRPPLYPLLLAASRVVFGDYFLLAMRVLQFLVGVAVAYVCFLIALRLFGGAAAAISFALALVMPTLVFSSIELQTEELAALVIVLFLYFLLLEAEPEKSAAIGLGLTSGWAMLLRFNCAVLPIIGAIVCIWFRRSLRDAAVVCLLAGSLLSPWLIRNLSVFRGSVLYSTHSGINLLEGILAPEGRAQDGDDERIRAAVGWLHTDLELNDPERLKFGPEDMLDQQARAAAILAWKNIKWKNAVGLFARKLAWFWLSLDQLLETNSFPQIQRKLRAIAVIVYWLVLIFALCGLFCVSLSRAATKLIFFYVLFITLAHLPFVMNTRLRIPFFDPLLAILSAGGIAFLVQNLCLALYSSSSSESAPNRAPENICEV
jgi:4-amino-4-deoxy-L-arabinose transferase-like glycosyltransferase